MTRFRAVTIGAVLCVLFLPRAAAAQYTLTAESGDTVQFESTALRAMLDTAKALYTDLQEDPRVAYITPLGREKVSTDDPEASYPWNVVTVVDDSTADLQRLPANLREADRAYYNYAVQRMRVVRGADPDVPCDSVLALEEGVVGFFVDGWILSRTLFGGPPFAPLDELVFARRAGLLRPLLARLNDRQVGACAGQWADDNLERVAAYDAWRLENFPLAGDSGEKAEPEADPSLSPDEPEGGEPAPDASIQDGSVMDPGAPASDEAGVVGDR